jgi:hypothetical protein
MAGNVLTSAAFGDHVLDAAKANGRGIADYLGKRIRRHLSKEFGRVVEPIVVLDASPSDRLHAHGSFVLANDNEPSKAKAALRAADGKLEGMGAQHQVDVTLQWWNDGWATYLFDRPGKARKLTGGAFYFMPNSLRRRAQELYGLDRDLRLLSRERQHPPA